MHPYSGMDTTVAWKKLRFMLSDIHMTGSLPIAVHAFANHDVIFCRWDAISEVDELVH